MGHWGIRMEKTWKRRNYLVKKKFQGRYIFCFFLFVVLGSMLYTAVFSILSANTLAIVRNGNNLSLGNTPVDLFVAMLSANWILILSGGIVVVIGSIFLTHRIAGPIHRFERTIDGMALGNLDFRLKLRKHDECKDVAEAINRLKNTLASNIDSMKQLSDAIDNDLKRASASVPGGNNEISSILSHATKISGQLRQILDSYTTEKQ
jgi:methyl-accepting chemotaxis protein